MNIQFPAPLADALSALARKGIFPTAKSSAELRELGADFHRLNFASARTMHAGYLQQLQDGIARLGNLGGGGGEPGSSMSLADFRAMAKSYLRGIGYAAEPGEEDTIKDLASDERINLVAETNLSVVQGYGQKVAANRAVKTFPCQELVRAFSTGEQRDWKTRFVQAGGKLSKSGRMIARVDDPVWQNLGDGAGGYNDTLGNAWAPFAFRSGMRTRLVSRIEAVREGVIAEDEDVQPAPVKLAPRLESFVGKRFSPGIADALKKALSTIQ